MKQIFLLTTFLVLMIFLFNACSSPDISTDENSQDVSASDNSNDAVASLIPMNCKDLISTADIQKITKSSSKVTIENNKLDDRLQCFIDQGDGEHIMAIYLNLASDDFYTIDQRYQGARNDVLSMVVRTGNLDDTLVDIQGVGARAFTGPEKRAIGVLSSNQKYIFIIWNSRPDDVAVQERFVDMAKIIDGNLNKY